jgi:hypothetical protein
VLLDGLSFLLFLIRGDKQQTREKQKKTQASRLVKGGLIQNVRITRLDATSNERYWLDGIIMTETQPARRHNVIEGVISICPRHVLINRH